MRRIALVLVAAALLSGCFTRLDEPYVVEGATVTATPDYFLTDDRCAEGEPVQLIRDLGEPDEALVDHAPTVAGADGAFSIPFQADEQGFFTISASCSQLVDDVLVPWTFAGQFLTVGPELVMAADPAGDLEPGEGFTVTGPFCVSTFPDYDDPEDPGFVEPPFPTVSVTFEGETQQLVAEEHQPFGETWSVELTAPETPGEYVVTATCTYDDGFVEVVDGAPAAVGTAAAVDSDYAPLDVVVAAPAPSPTPTPTPTPAPGARPVTSAPTYTG